MSPANTRTSGRDNSVAPRPLVVEDLVAGYLDDLDIVRGVSINIDRGEIVAVLGPNGAGKSTLVKSIFGLVPVRSGRVLLDGEDVTGTRPSVLARHGVGYVPQLNNVFARLTVKENLEIGSSVRPQELHERMEEVFEMFPLLAERLRQDAALLSGGERQMLAIARALMASPRLLLLDEPSAALAPIAVREVFDRIIRINEAGVAVVIVEQNARMALEVAHRGYVLESGKARFEGSGHELLSNRSVVELYLGGMPLHEATN